MESNKIRLDNVKDITDFPEGLQPISKEMVKKYINNFNKELIGGYKNIYEGFFNTMNELKCISFENGYLLIINKAFERILGYDLGEIIGEMAIKFIHPDDIESTINVQKYLLETNNDLSRFENRWRCKNGKYVSLEWNSTKMGKYYFSTGRVIENHNDYLSKIMHEIRNPLNCIVGFASLLKDSENINLDEHENIQCISDSCNHLTNIIDDIMELKMVSKGFSIENINLHNFLREHFKVYQIELSKKKLKLEYHHSYFNNQILFEKSKLEQIMRNLISNAIKFNKENGKIVVKSELIKLKNNNKIKIIISDTGKGISKMFVKKIFIPFHREYQNIKGTGLGLSIVKKIIEIYDGEIEIKSNKDVGTDIILTFTIIGNYKSLNNNEIDIYDYNQNKINNKLTLLYVEDEESNILLMKKIIDKIFDGNINFNSVICSSEAIKFIKNQIPDILILDYHLPDYDADELYSKIKIINGSENIKMVCIISANVKISDMNLLQNMGIKKYLVKPITILQIRNMFDLFKEYFV